MSKKAMFDVIDPAFKFKLSIFQAVMPDFCYYLVLQSVTSHGREGGKIRQKGGVF
jgi:hypothetical protein